VKLTATTEQILPEQVKLLYEQLGLGAIASVVNAAILCLLLWAVQPAAMLGAWFALIVVVNLPRYWLVSRYRRVSDIRPNVAPWARGIIISNLASGLVWGAGAYVLFPETSLPHQVFLAFILAGMTAGAVPLYSAMRGAYAAYMLPALLPFAWRLADGGSQVHIYMALLVMFFTLVLLISSRRTHATIVESLKLRYANNNLLGTLTTAQQELEANNRKLQKNVIEIEAAKQAVQRSNALLSAISRAQMQFIQKPNLQEMFDGLLANLLELTGSEYGFIGQVLRQADGTPYLKTYALTNIAWNDETREFYAQHAPAGLEFKNLGTLFGAVMLSGKPVISNNPASDARAGGLPVGHPPLNAFLGVPFFHGGEMIGMVGISNRQSGYDMDFVEELAPFLHTCATIIHGERVSASQRAAEASLLETEAELRGIHAHIVEGIATFDQKGCFMTANPALERMFGTPVVRLKDMPFARLLKLQDRERWADLFGDFLRDTQSGATVEFQALRADMITTFPIEISLSLMRVAAEPRVIAVLRDVTERKKVERMKSEFIATVSHELRTPLTAIRGALGLLAGGVQGELEEPSNELLRIALNNSKRLGHLINDLLDMEKIGSSDVEFNFCSVDVAELIAESIQANRGFAEQYAVVLQVDDIESGLSVWVDAERLLQVMANLLSNAVKFSSAGGLVRVRAWSRDDYAWIEVHDSGAGIPEEFQASVFEKFTQADASDTRAAGGTGLGLYISKIIVERLQGRIGFSSTPGLGTTFHIGLPKLQPQST
jgi:PAS domain S-box-containing protein